jgi:protein-disulfide isomerase
MAARRAASRTPVRPRFRFGILQVTALSVVAGLGLIVALVLLGSKPAALDAPLVRAVAPAGIPAAGLVLGSAAAPVTIDVYEDFQCPACFRWGRDVLPTLARHELADGRVKLAFHGFAFLGPESIAAARAAWAAERQGRFWDMWATLYANQGSRENAGAFSRDRLIAMADLVGLDHDRFVTDFDSAASASAVSESGASAAAAGISGTPSLVISGRPVGTAGYADLSTAIAAAAR